VLANEDADAAHNTLTALHGIGPWTADVYLLFCLGHGDAWPAGDLAVQEAVKIGLGLRTRPTAKQMAPLAEPWRPLRGAAAHLWWAYYRAVKKREGVIGGEPKALFLNKCLLQNGHHQTRRSRLEKSLDRKHEIHRLHRCTPRFAAMQIHRE
jgi:DNA-3-methyladenine glycosylase II